MVNGVLQASAKLTMKSTEMKKKFFLDLKLVFAIFHYF